MSEENKYVAQLKSDLIEQFKGQPVIEALLEAIGKQLTEVYEYYTDLRESRSLETAVGNQLDGIGDIVVLSRMEAGELACYQKSVFVLDDEDYRYYIKNKIWKNNCNCTYADIIKGFKMFWTKPLYYSESIDEPATMILETEPMELNPEIERLSSAPIIKAAGVGLKVVIHINMPEKIYMYAVAGEYDRETLTREIELIADGDAPVYIGIGASWTKYVDIKAAPYDAKLAGAVKEYAVGGEFDREVLHGD
jgi:hypothetical protein